MMTKLDELKQLGKVPYWMAEEAYVVLTSGYLTEGEEPVDMYRRVSKAASKHYRKLGLAKEMEAAFFDMLWQGFLGLSSPIAANMGAFRVNKEGKKVPRALPVSCFGVSPDNSIEDIMDKASTIAAQTKNGGGTSIYLGQLDSDTPLSHWAQIYDTITRIIRQGGVRRGAIAQYIDIGDRDFDLMMAAKDMNSGDLREKLDCNIGVFIPDSFMESLKNKDPEAIRRFGLLMKTRMTTGSPYIIFESFRRNLPYRHEELGFIPKHSNLCTEIRLFADKNYSFTCVISSLNLAKFDEWKDKTYNVSGFGALSVPKLGIFFLDAVNSEFIKLAKKSKDRKALTPAIKFAEDFRAVGLGVLGYHTYLQSKGIAFESDEARVFNEQIFSYIQEEAETASLVLGDALGVPKHSYDGHRNTYKLAVAPTLMNATILGASNGIEPIFSNAYTYVGAKGSFKRRNPELQGYIEQSAHHLASDSEEGYSEFIEDIWQRIEADNGSIQRIPLFSPEIKAIFKTAMEIDQFKLIQLAADRAKYVDQAVSNNLFIPSDTDPSTIWKLHIEAWKLGVPTLYYVRSTNNTKAMDKSTVDFNFTAHLKTRPTCPYCNEAKDLLNLLGIQYTEEIKESGRVPEITLTLDDGSEFPLVDGYSSLVSYVRAKLDELDGKKNDKDLDKLKASIPPDEPGCLSCQ